jgi:adenylosuccinate lyase
MDSSYYALSPLDGRYKKVTETLSNYFSEFALVRTRYEVEVRYFKFLVKLLYDEEVELKEYFTKDDFAKVKEIEKKTNHDVKALEYFIRGLVEDKKYKELVHFGLTSEDVNNVALNLNVGATIREIIMPEMSAIVTSLSDQYQKYRNVPMLSRTHGQIATPTTLGKEMMVFHDRLLAQFQQLQRFKKRFVRTCKFGGAVGNLNAHYATMPDVDWTSEMDRFIQGYGMSREKFTTQVGNYDNLSELLGVCQRINTILVDYCRDMWQYISLGYFKQEARPEEVGSSTMPHKVNPIKFENAEGNLGLANKLIFHMQEVLPVSRLQRDLTNSTVLRNLGVVFGHMLVSYNSILDGVSRVDVDREKIYKDLDNHWEVVVEPIQTKLRLLGYPNAYDALKEFSRGSHVTKESVSQFIDALDVGEEVKKELRTYTPHTYIGRF